MIGLIFGDTDFPKEILKKIKKKKLKYLIIDLSKKRTFKKDKNSKIVSIGQFGKIINLLKENKCKKVLFAGKVNKPKFSKLRLDFKGVYYMPRIIKSFRIGDAAVLKEIIQIFKREKIATISSLFFNTELALKKGIYTKIKPNSIDNADINKALEPSNIDNWLIISTPAIKVPRNPIRGLIRATRESIPIRLSSSGISKLNRFLRCAIIKSMSLL